jgi:outer membrane immunogenic protein
MKTFPASLMFLIVLRAFSAHADEAIGSTISQTTRPPMWTGFYVGLNAGGFWNNTSAPTTFDWSRLTAPGNFAYSSAFASVPQTGFAWTNGAGFAGGGQVGYNWQLTDKVVVGVETDFQRIAGGGNNWNTGWLAGSSSSRGPSFIGTVRGRGGYLVAPNMQIYGTGGFSYSGGN